MPANSASERCAIARSYDDTAVSPDLTVEISPREAVERYSMTARGLMAEFIQLNVQAKVEFRFHAPMHLLAAYHQGMRRDGETLIEGSPRSQRRDLSQRLSFVPAGREYREWHQPRTLSGLMFVYLDPATLQRSFDLDAQGVLSEPRLFFDHQNLWNTMVKLRSLVASPRSSDRALSRSDRSRVGA